MEWVIAFLVVIVILLLSYIKIQRNIIKNKICEIEYLRMEVSYLKEKYTHIN